MMSYSGGAHKSMTGTFTFLNQSAEKNIGTLNFHSNTTGNNTVFVVLSGNFTPAQRNIVKTRCSIDVKEFNFIFSGLRTNNPIFAKMESSENCPTPTILEDDAGIDEESEGPTVENHVDIQY
jgi:hypothetical protein